MSEKNKVQKFDPEKAMKDIKNRIKMEFVQMIPDEQWKEMVQKNIYVFINKELSEIVRTEISIITTKKVKQYLESKEFDKVYDEHGKPKTSEAIEKIFIKNSNLVLTNFISTIMDNQFQQIRYELGQKGIHLNY